MYLVQKRCLRHNFPLPLVFECSHRATGSLLQQTRQDLQECFFSHLKTLLESVECSTDHFLCCSKYLNAAFTFQQRRGLGNARRIFVRSTKLVAEKKKTNDPFNCLCAAKYKPIQCYFFDDDEFRLSAQKKDYACFCSKEEPRLDRDSGDSLRELNGPITYQNDL